MASAKQGHRYRARIELSFFERVVSNETIAGKLRDAGFVNVEVLGSGGVRWAFGTWPSADADAALPPQITHVDDLGAQP